MMCRKYVIPFLLWCSSLFPLTSDWTLDANGNWATGTPANWSAGVPNAVDDVAQFLSAITAPRIVSLSQATTVGSLQFNSGFQYTVDANTLTFQTSTGNPQITVSGGSHIISSAMALANDLILNNSVAGNPILTLSGVISGVGGITLSGTTGNVTITGATPNTYTGLTTINSPGNTLFLSKAANNTAISGDVTVTAGTLNTGVPGQFGNASKVTVNGGTFTVGAAVAETMGRLSYQAGTLNINAGSIFTLTDNVTALNVGVATTFNNPFNFSGSGAVVFDMATPSNILTFSSTSTLGLGSNTREFRIPNQATNAIQILSVVSGTGGIIKMGPGLLTFDGGAVNNTYTGVTAVIDGVLLLNRTAGSTCLPGDVLISGGNLEHGASEQIANTSTFIFESGLWQLANYTETIDRLDFLEGTFFSTGGQLNLTSNGTALQMRGGTLLSGGNVTLTGTGDVVFDPSIGGTATIGNLDLGGNAHPFNIGNGSGDPDMNISGILTNGDLVKTGAGNLALSGSSPNTFGTTTVNGGTLTLAKNSGIAAVTGTVNINGGTLLTQNNNQFDLATTVTLSSGAFTIGGTTQTIDTVNYYGGTVTPFNGFLDISSGGTLKMRNTVLDGNIRLLNPAGGTIIFDATNNGTAVLNGTIQINGPSATFNIADGTATDDMIVNSVISGNQLIKSGPGTLYLLGANTYTGGTSVTAGTLKGNTTSLQGNITNSAILEFEQPFNGAFNGTLSGQGDMIMSGGGNLTFNTPQALGGTVTIQAGTLTVNSQFNNDPPGMGALTINSGATLGGIGFVEKDIIAYGTISPGDNSIGTLSTGGDVTMNGGSTLYIEITSNTNDLLNVGGAYNINPNSEFFFQPLADVYVEPLNYTVVQAAGGVNGTFQIVSDPYPLIEGSLEYLANSILLHLDLIPVSNLLGLSGNAQKVAHCLDARNPSPEDDLYRVINSLRLVESVESIEKSLLSMQPSIFSALSVVNQSSTLYIRNAIYNRLEIYTRSCAEEKQRYHIWIAPLLGISEENNHGKQVGYNALTPGVAVGADTFFFKELQLGASVGYTNSKLDWKRFRGDARIQGVYGSVYGRYGGQVGYLESAVIFGYDHYSTQRNIKVHGLIPIHRIAKATHHGFEGSAHLKGAFHLPVNNTQLGPYISFDYLYEYEGSFKEYGSDSLNLDISSKHANLLVSEIGMDLSHCFHLARKILTPHIHVSGIWEKRMNGGYEESTFGGCPIDLYGYYPSRFLVGAAAGFDVKWALENALRASFQYKGKYGLGYQDHSLNLILMY